MRRLSIFMLTMVLAAGCSSAEQPQRKLTKAERDSIIGESALPGAAVVKGALAEDDKQKRRSAVMDSLYKASGD